MADDENNNRSEDESRRAANEAKKREAMMMIIRTLVNRLQYQNSSSPNVFIKICCDLFKVKNPSSGLVLQWYERIKTLFSSIPVSNNKAISNVQTSLITGCLSFKHLVGSHNLTHSFRLVNGSPRYAIHFNPREICVFDYFHGKTKRFEFNPNDSTFASTKNSSLGKFDGFNFADIAFDDLISHKVYPINSTCILVFQQKHSFMGELTGDESSNSIYLIRLDCETNEPKTMDNKTIKNHGIDKLLFDSENPNSFMIFNWKGGISLVFEGNDCYAQFVHILNDKLIVDEVETKIGYGRISCPRLKNGMLSGFCLKQNNDGEMEFEDGSTKICYWTFESGKLEKKFEFQEVEEIDLQDFTESMVYAWLEDKCFLTAKQKVAELTQISEFRNNPSVKNCLYSFDLLTQKCTLIYLNFMKVSHFHFDFDGNLVANKDKRLFYYEIKKPQKLEQVVWREIRRQSMFFNNNALYENAMKRLPLSSELQPFNC